MKIAFEPPAECEIAVLPDARVVTRDGVPVEADMEFYACYSPTKAVAYRVLSDTAYRRKNGPWKVWVIGSLGYSGEMTPIEHSTDINEWLTFYKKRHKGRLPPCVTDKFTGDKTITNEISDASTGTT